MPAASSARLLQKVMAIHRVVKKRVPILVSSKIIANTQDELGGIYLHVRKVMEFDMPEKNRTEVIASIRFDTKDDFKDFVNELKELVV